MRATVKGGRWQATTRPHRQATTNNESVWQIMMAPTKRARVARAMVIAMRVAGDEEGKGGTLLC